MRPDDAVRLRHMLDAAKKAVEFARGKSEREIAGTRDRLVHGYFDVDLHIVGRIVTKDLPALIKHLEKLVP